MKTIAKFIVILAILPMVISSCKKASDSGDSGMAGMTINLTDAPSVQFSALYIDVLAIQAHTEKSGWVTLNSSLGVINVLDYVNGRTALLTEGELPAGRLDQLRLILGPTNSIIVNGTTYNLTVDSIEGAHLIFPNPWSLLGRARYTWTIDFDAPQSIVKDVHGNYLLRPVLRLIAEASKDCDYDHDTTVLCSDVGKISGDVVDSSVTSLFASICATDAANNHTSCTMSEKANGDFSIRALPGTYSLSITTLIPPFTTKVVTGVVVTSGQTTNVGNINL